MDSLTGVTGSELSGLTGTFIGTMQSGEINEDNTFKILVASDIHLGFCDTNPARENDSFNTFEEILKIGREEEVDFVLLGGDLFHENKPKPATLQRTIEIMRKYCLGSRPVEFEYLGDPKVDFPNQDEPEVNFLNPNMNIAMPVFTIHGNHDDPIGIKKTSAVDHLVAAKLLNHFGQWDSLTDINVKAVPLVKGETKLALFGLGNIKDERLFRLIRDNQVKFVRPKESCEDWFNIFVLHQNRTKHGPKNYIPESFLPYFFHLIVWGHEHECRIEPEPTTANTKSYIIQPGSPVATSLCAGEEREKFCGILYVNCLKFRLEPIKLNTVRPMLLEDIDTKHIPVSKGNRGKEQDPAQAVERYVQTKVDMLLQESTDKLTGHPNQPLEPLVRVRVFHRNVNETFNPVRFAQRYAGKIANDDIVMFKHISERKDGDEMDMEDMDEMFRQHEDPDLDSHVEAIVESYFAKAREAGDTTNILEVLSEKGLSEAVKTCVEKDDKEAIGMVLETQIKKVMEFLIRENANEEELVEEALVKFREARWANPNVDVEEAANLLRNRPIRKKKAADDDDDEEDDVDESGMDQDEEPSVIESDDEVMAPPKGKGRGRGRGKSAAAPAPTRGRGRGKGRAKGSSNSNEDSETSSAPSPKRGGRGKAAATTKGTAKKLVQSTLQVTRSPRKPRQGGAGMVFDVSDDSD